MADLPRHPNQTNPAVPPDDEGFPGLSRQLRGDDAGAPPLAPVLGRFDPDLTQFVIDEITNAGIHSVLTRLIRDTRASSGMVLDRAGQIIVFEGENYRREMMQLGALIAGTYASTREMARILHEENFRTLLQEGAKEKIFTEAVGDQWLVSVIFDRQTHLGLVKVLCSRASVDLGQVLVQAIERSRAQPRLRDMGLQRIASDTIDLLFRNEPEK